MKYHDLERYIVIFVLVKQNMSSHIEDDDTWEAVKSFVEENGLVSAQIRSFNDFIYKKSHQIVQLFKHVVIEEKIKDKPKRYILELSDLVFQNPSFTEKDDTTIDLFPVAAMQRNITYCSPMYVDVTVVTPSGEKTFYEKIFLGNMPVMVKSDLCNLSGINNDPQSIAKHKEDYYDQGGYFVIAPKGENTVAQRRILVPQERSAPNKVYIFTNRKNHPKYEKYAEIRSLGSNVHTTTTTVGYMASGKRISAILPWIDATEIPLQVLFFALGVTSYIDIYTFIVGPPDSENGKTWIDEKKKEKIRYVMMSLEYSYEIPDQESALHFIGKKGKKFVKDTDDVKDENDGDEETFEGVVQEKKFEYQEGDIDNVDKEKASAISYAKHLLCSEFFSHVGNHLDDPDELDEKFLEKAKYLGYAINKLLLVMMRERKPESRDHYMNKRVLTSGALLTQQFYGGLRRLVMEITKNTKKALRNGNTVNISSWIKPTIMTNAMQGAISGNNWTTGGAASKGISQLYDQFNYTSSIANARKNTVPIAAEGGKVIEPRDLHGSHFGLICVTGDTLVLLADGKTLCRIDELEGKAVMTVNTKTLKSEPSGIYNFFKMMPKKLLEIKDDCGRTLRCTPDHPFLVRRGEENVWVSAGDLKVDDPVIVAPYGLDITISYISSIEEIKPEYVYDFTTYSENHSFISNEFVTHQCPAETPEGKKAGLVKNFALLSFVTTGSEYEPVRKLILKLVGTNAVKNYPQSLNWTRVFLNGVPVGFTKKPAAFASRMREYRRKVKITSEISIVYFDRSNEIHMCVDAGRLCRPLFVVEDGKLLFDVEKLKQSEAGEITWTDLLASGSIELIDKMEEEECLVAGYPSDLEKMSKDEAKQYTHCEIHPSLMYGIGGSIVPFSNHNQSPRVCYQASMGKQAIGIPFSNYRELMCGTFHTMMYVHKPLVITKAGSIIHFDELPAGQQAIIAVMPAEFNEEDSIMMNEDSIDRGFMVSFKWTAVYAEIREEKSEQFGVPSEGMEKFKGNPRHLLESGYPKPGSKIEKGDVVIGKYTEQVGEYKGQVVRRYVDCSQIYDHEWPSVVDKVMHGTTGDGYRFIRVMLCQKRKPVVGDKFSFMHGQKGTIGMIKRAVDLPFNRQGITPDIIMNSLALPSRMTIAMLIEGWTGKVILSSSILHEVKVDELTKSKNKKDKKTKDKLKSGPSKEFRDMYCHKNDPISINATPCRKIDIEVIRKEMKKYGLEYGDEYLRDGVTGKELRVPVFFVPAFNQRLKHMVIDKIHARAKGGKTTLMRQPREGRKDGGGLRFGIMERDCMLGQGAGKFTTDRMIVCSDDFSQWICDTCGIDVGNKEKGCAMCGKNKISLVRLPYGTKIVSQELMAMNIIPRVLQDK